MSEIDVWFIGFGVFCLLLFGLCSCFAIDAIINSDACDKPGFNYKPRVYFIGEKKCVFNQEKYDRDVRSYTIE